MEKAAYLEVLIVVGAGAGFEVVQALRPSEATAKAARAAILTNFM